MKKSAIIFFAFLVLISARAEAEDDFQYWSRYSFQILDTEYVDISNYSEMRFFDDAGDFSLWLTTQKLKVDPFKFLSLEAHYTFLQIEVLDSKSGEEEFKNQHRLELEVSPHWTWDERLTISNRNRLTFRWIEGKGSDNGRFRQMWGLSYAPKNVKWLKSVYANDEIFYDFNTRSFNQNRLTPIGFKFPLYGKTTWQLFYMVQFQKKDTWSSNHILGSQLNIAF